MNTITRDGATWELRAPREVHYSTRREDGHVFLHANPKCTHLATADAVVLSPKIVKTLWEKDVEAGSSADDNDVQWCESCATRRVDTGDEPR